jgi:hypothetical protein
MAHYHISWNELMWGIPWATIQRIMIDAPNYKPNKLDNTVSEKKGPVMTKDNTKDIIAMMNAHVMGG